MAGGASAADRERLAEFGSAIGLAFQLADDLLDVTADSQAMGKATGKDQAAGKATLVALHGVDWAKRQLGGLVAQAQELLGVYGERVCNAEGGGQLRGVATQLTPGTRNFNVNTS